MILNVIIKIEEVVTEFSQSDIFSADFSMAMIGLVGTIITAFFGIFPSIIQSNIKEFIGYDVIDLIRSDDDLNNVFGDKFLKAMCVLGLIILFHIFQAYCLAFMVSMILIYRIAINQSEYLKLIVPKLFYEEVKKRIYLRIENTDAKKFELLKILGKINLEREDDIDELLNFAVKPIDCGKYGVLYPITSLQKIFTENSNFTEIYLKYLSGFLKKSDIHICKYELRMYDFRKFIINHVTDENVDNVIDYLLDIIKYDIYNDNDNKRICYVYNFENIYMAFKNNHLLTNNRQNLNVLLKLYSAFLQSSSLSEYLKYGYTFYLFKYFIDNLDEDGLEYVFFRFKNMKKLYLNYVLLSLMAYIYYLESEEDSVVDKLAKKYIKDNLEERLRVIVKMIYNLNINVDDYFNWLDETVYTWKRHKLSFGQIGEYYKTDNLDNIIINLKKAVVILKAKNNELNFNIDAIKNIDFEENIDLENLIKFFGIEITDDDIKSCKLKIFKYYENEFINKSLENKNLSTDFIKSINSCENKFLEKLKLDLDNVNAGKKVETIKQNFCKYYILKKDLYSDKQDFIDTVAFSEILDALEGNFLDYLTRLDEAIFSESEIKRILNKNKNKNEDLEEFVLLGNVENSYLKELEQRLSTFPIKKNIPEYTKTILVKNYYADVQSIDINTCDLTLDLFNNIYKTNFISNEIIYNFAKEKEKYYLYDIKKKFEIDKEITEEYLKNNYIMIKVECVIYTNKNNNDLS